MTCNFVEMMLVRSFTGIPHFVLICQKHGHPCLTETFKMFSSKTTEANDSTNDVCKVLLFV